MIFQKKKKKMALLPKKYLIWDAEKYDITLKCKKEALQNFLYLYKKKTQIVSFILEVCSEYTYLCSNY